MKRYKFFPYMIAACFLHNFTLASIPKAELYNKNSVMQTTLAEELLLIDLVISGDEEILDIGCGDGKLTKEIARTLTEGKITAIDKSAHMIDFAKAHNNHSNIDYLVMGVDEIEKLNKKFDAIIVFSAFHWFDKPKEALQKMNDRLKPGGKIYIITYPVESPDWVYYEEAFMAKEKWSSFFKRDLYKSFFSAQDFEIEAQRLGLSIRKNQIADRFQIYSHIEDFKNCVKGWLEWFAPQLPLSEYDEYTDIVVEKGMSQFSYNNDGQILIPYKSITVILEKIN